MGKEEKGRKGEAAATQIFVPHRLFLLASSVYIWNVDGEERKTPTRILEEPAQPSFLPSVNSYRLFLLQVHGRAHFFEFLCVTRNCDSGYDE